MKMPLSGEACFFIENALYKRRVKWYDYKSNVGRNAHGKGSLNK